MGLIMGSWGSVTKGSVVHNDVADELRSNKTDRNGRISTGLLEKSLKSFFFIKLQNKSINCHNQGWETIPVSLLGLRLSSRVMNEAARRAMTFLLLDSHYSSSSFSTSII